MLRRAFLGAAIVTAALPVIGFAQAAPTAEHYIQRGSAFLAKMDNASAIADFTTAITLDSSKWRAVVLRALAYANMGDYDRAQADVEWLARNTEIPAAELGGLYRAVLRP